MTWGGLRTVVERGRQARVQALRSANARQQGMQATETASARARSGHWRAAHLQTMTSPKRSEEVISRPGEDAVSEGSRVSIGQTRAGRSLRVIYVPTRASKVYLSSPRTSCGENHWRPIDAQRRKGQ